LHVGHGGKTCENSRQEWTSESYHDFGEVIEEEDPTVLDDQDSDADDTVLVIVHSTGVFQHRVRWCTCSSAPKHNIQLLHSALFPASMKLPRTAFTFDVLDHFYVDSMECKTSANSFFMKLRRLTNSAFPDLVQVWSSMLPFTFSNMVNRTGIVNSPEFPDNGGTCNLESDLDLAMKGTKNLELGTLLISVLHVRNPESICLKIGGTMKTSLFQFHYIMARTHLLSPRFLFYRNIVTDGNFSADSMKMKNPMDDVALSDGRGFMVQDGPYQNHLQEAKEIPQVSQGQQS
jgi:hypothetical protein